MAFPCDWGGLCAMHPQARPEAAQPQVNISGMCSLCHWSGRLQLNACLPPCLQDPAYPCSCVKGTLWS